MVAFICLFIPAVLAMWLYETLSKQKLQRREWFYRYSGYLLFINLGAFLVKRIVLQNDAFPLYELMTDMPPSTAINYLVMVLPIAIALVVAEVVCKRIFCFRFGEVPSRTQKRPKWLSILLTVLCILGFFLCFLAFFSARWYIKKYGDIGFDSILFTFLSDLNGLQSGLISSYIKVGLLPAVVLTAIVSFYMLYTPKKSVQVSCFGKKFVTLFPLKKTLKILLSILLCIALVFTAAWQVELINYLKFKSKTGTLYEDHYVEPSSVDIQFPAKKMNVIHIMLESMETSFFAKADGGALEYNVMPELFSLAQNNINFSHTSGVGGFPSVPGSRYTSAAMVSLTSGTPFFPPVGIDPMEYGADQYLPGLTTMMDILHANGYDQTLMVGSNASYGGRKTYYLNHGVDRVYEIDTARAEGVVPADYSAWWGMEDEHVFEYAKRKLPEIAASGKPFSFTMLTTDTHHIGGYVCNLCGTHYQEQYENVYACSSAQVNDFLEWLKTQDFYENTVIVITGDHLSMDNGYFERNVDSNYDRRVYNCFINSCIDTEYDKNRSFSALDMMPTILAAMGCTFEGDRLGLGTNLFSGKPTMIEELGADVFDRKVCEVSDYYTKNFYFDR